MSRRELDYYPTPPDAVDALHGWLRRAGWLGTGPGWMDPAAGFGGLLEGLPGLRHAIELDASRERDLLDVADEVTIGDALAVEWPRAACIVANPPFNRLDEFMARIWEHVTHPGNGQAIACVLTRLQWLDEGDRAAKWTPGMVLRMPWRQSFTGDGRADSTTHCWLVYGTVGRSTAVEWLPRPLVSDERWARFRALTRRSGGVQGRLDLAGGAWPTH